MTKSITHRRFGRYTLELYRDGALCEAAVDIGPDRLTDEREATLVAAAREHGATSLTIWLEGTARTVTVPAEEGGS